MYRWMQTMDDLKLLREYVEHDSQPAFATLVQRHVNLVDADSIEQLAQLVSRIEESPALTVVVFSSANPAPTLP